MLHINRFLTFIWNDHLKTTQNKNLLVVDQFKKDTFSWDLFQKTWTINGKSEKYKDEKIQVILTMFDNNPEKVFVTNPSNLNSKDQSRIEVAEQSWLSL